MDLKLLLSRGYFPSELPHPFNTVSYASVISGASTALPKPFADEKRTSLQATHNLARAGSLRRKLSIPNPTNFYRLASFIVRNRSHLLELAQKSRISLSAPGDGAGPRAINPRYSLDKLPLERARVRASSKFVLQADISRFYESVYTHSIPGAIQTKAKAKANRSTGLLGNALDRHIRNGQDGQTVGIPIGPDTSLLVAEILLGAIDAELPPKIRARGFRNIDDYEFGFSTYANAENALGLLQELLNHYELALNPKKTSVIELPVPIESPWIAELRSISFRDSRLGQQFDLVRYFDRAFEMSAEDPDQGILKYAIARMNGTAVLAANWGLYQDLLAQCCLIEPGVLRFVLGQLARYGDAYKINARMFRKTMNQLIAEHAPLGHGSEVAWAIWVLILLNSSLDRASAKAASTMEDPVVALVALHAQSKGLTPKRVTFSHFATHMTREELYGDHWLLSYEADVKGWLPPFRTKNHVDADACFGFMKSHGVSFYDHSLTMACAVPRPVGESRGRRYD